MKLIKFSIHPVSIKLESYYTEFDYDIYPEDVYCIIHRQPAIPYSEEMATYPEYFTVLTRPSLEEAEVIFKICKPNNLCAGIKNARTVKL